MTADNTSPGTGEKMTNEQSDTDTDPTPPAVRVTTSPGTGHVSTGNLSGELEAGTAKTAVESIGGDTLLSLELEAGESRTVGSAHLGPAQARAVGVQLLRAANVADSDPDDIDGLPQLEEPDTDGL